MVARRTQTFGGQSWRGEGASIDCRNPDRYRAAVYKPAVGNGRWLTPFGDALRSDQAHSRTRGGHIDRRSETARTGRVKIRSVSNTPGRGHDECPLPRSGMCIFPSANSKCHYAVAAMVDRTDDMHRSAGWRQAAFRWQYRGPGRPHAHTKLLTPLSRVRYPPESDRAVNAKRDVSVNRKSLGS